MTALEKLAAVMQDIKLQPLQKAAPKDPVEKAAALLRKQASRIRELEQLSNRSEEEDALLRAFTKLARAIASRKGVPIAPVATASEIIQKVAPPKFEKISV